MLKWKTIFDSFKTSDCKKKWRKVDFYAHELAITPQDDLALRGKVISRYMCALRHFWAFLFLATVVDFLRTETSLKSFLPLESFSHCLWVAEPYHAVRRRRFKYKNCFKTCLVYSPTHKFYVSICKLILEETLRSCLFWYCRR